MARRDLGSAVEFENGAVRGEVDQLFNLGMVYATGRDAPQDLIAAHKWFNLAAMRGSDEARQRRAEIAREMSADEIAAAQREARDWLAVH